MDEVDQMLRQFKETKKLALAEASNDEQPTEQTEPTSTPPTTQKPIQPDRDGDGSQKRTRKSTSTSDYTPVDIDRRLAENYRPTDVPQWMYRTMRTRTYAAGHSPVYHADRTCRELQTADPDRVKIFPLRFVVTRDVNPSRPCFHCTMDLDHSIRVAIEYDFVDPRDVVYDSDVVQKRVVTTNFGKTVREHDLITPDDQAQVNWGGEDSA